MKDRQLPSHGRSRWFDPSIAHHEETLGPDFNPALFISAGFRYLSRAGAAKHYGQKGRKRGFMNRSGCRLHFPSKISEVSPEVPGIAKNDCNMLK